MSVESVVLALNCPNVSPAERLVLIGIANHDGDGGAWPSLSTLARYACVTERSVQRTLRVLEGRGLVTIQQNAGGTVFTRNDHRPNRYVLHLGRGDAGVGGSPSRGDADVAHGVTPASPEPSLNHPYPPTPRKRGAMRQLDHGGCRRDYDSTPLTPEQIYEKYGVTEP